MSPTSTDARPEQGGPTASASEQRFRRVLLASEGRPYGPEVLRHAARLLGGQGGRAHVISIARVYGTSFGFPNPGLLPTKREWSEQEKRVHDAVSWLRRRGITATGEVVGTRRAAQRICQEAIRMGSEAIVMGADADRSWLAGEFIWSQEPQRVRRRATVPVFLVPITPAAP